jgi:phosphatidate phosphatase PAH1
MEAEAQEEAVAVLEVVAAVAQADQEEEETVDQEEDQEVRMVRVTATTTKTTLMKTVIARDLRLHIDDYNMLRVNSGKNKYNTSDCGGRDDQPA